MSLDTVVKHHEGHRPGPCPEPRPPYKPQPQKPIPTKNVVLSHKFGKTVYALAVRTTTDAVFDSKYKYTLTEMLADLSDALVSNLRKINSVSEKFDALMEGCPEEFDTLKEIVDYINVDGENPHSRLLEILNNKVDKEEGKGLSTHDLTDILYEKIVNDYTKEQLDEKFDMQAAFNQSMLEFKASQEEFNETQTGINNDQAAFNDIQRNFNDAQREFNDSQTIVNNAQAETNADVASRLGIIENKPNVIVDDEDPDVKENDIWMQVESEYNPNN